MSLMLIKASQELRIQCLGRSRATNMENTVRMPIPVLESMAERRIEHRVNSFPSSIEPPDKSRLFEDTESRQKIAGAGKETPVGNRESGLDLTDAEYLTAHVTSLGTLIGDLKHCPAMLKKNPDGSYSLDDTIARPAQRGRNGFPSKSDTSRNIKGPDREDIQAPAFVCHICDINFAVKPFLVLHLLSATHMEKLAGKVETLRGEMRSDGVYPISIPEVDKNSSGPNYCGICDSRFKNSMDFRIHFASLTHVENLLELLREFKTWEKAAKRCTALSTKTQEGGRDESLLKCIFCATSFNKVSEMEAHALSEAHLSRREAYLCTNPHQLLCPEGKKEIMKEATLPEKSPAVSTTESKRSGPGGSADGEEIPLFYSTSPADCVADGFRKDDAKNQLKRQKSIGDRPDKRAEENSPPAKKRILNQDRVTDKPERYPSGKPSEQSGGHSSAMSAEKPGGHSSTMSAEKPGGYSSAPPFPEPHQVHPLPLTTRAMTAPHEGPQKPPKQSKNAHVDFAREQTALLHSASPKLGESSSMKPGTMIPEKATPMTSKMPPQSNEDMTRGTGSLKASIFTVAMLRVQVYQEQVSLSRAAAEAFCDEQALQIMPLQLSAHQTMMAVEDANRQMHELRAQILAQFEQGVLPLNLCPPYPNRDGMIISLALKFPHLQMYIGMYKELLEQYQEAIIEGAPTNNLPFLIDEQKRLTEELMTYSGIIHLISERPDLLETEDLPMMPPVQQVAPCPTDLSFLNGADTKFTEKQLSHLSSLLFLGRHPTDDEVRKMSRTSGLTFRTIKNWLSKHMKEEKAPPMRPSGSTGSPSSSGDSGIASSPDRTFAYTEPPKKTSDASIKPRGSVILVNENRSAARS